MGHINAAYDSESDFPSSNSQKLPHIKNIDPKTVENKELAKVKEFLLGCGMKQHLIEVFVENGFTEMTVLLDVDERDLEEMSVPKGFSIKLLKRIQEEKKLLEMRSLTFSLNSLI